MQVSGPQATPGTQSETASKHLFWLARLRLVACAGCLLGALLPTTGCLVRTRTVARTVAPPQVLDATLEQLIERTDVHFHEIKTLNASIEVNAETGGSRQGEIKEIPSFSGYIWMQKPGDLRLILLVPLVGSRALDMVSDGKDFKLYIPRDKKAIVGADEVTNNGKGGLYNLRPYMVRDALVIPPVADDQIVTRSDLTRILPPAPGTKEAIEEPVYSLAVLKIKKGREGQLLRIIRFGRSTLDPYEQDVYDENGRIVTVVTYSRYQKFGDFRFPALIEIDRPVDEFKLKLEFSKVTINGKLAGDEFVLKIPDEVQIQKM